MKRTIILSLLVVSMSLSTTAIYDPNNTHTSSNNSGPQELRTTAVPTSAPTDYSINFEQKTATCGPQGIDNASINSLNVSPDETTVNIDGVFQTTHPKYNLSHNIEKVENQHYILRIEGVETSEIAPKCIGNIEYSANFTSSEGYLLEVYHNETKIVESQMPESVNGTPARPEPSTDPESEADNQENNAEQDSKGFFTSIVAAFGNLF